MYDMHKIHTHIYIYIYFNISKRYNFKVEIRGGEKCRMYTKFFTSKCFIKLEVEY